MQDIEMLTPKIAKVLSNMKDIQINPLNQSQRRILQFGVVVLLAVFLAGWFYFMNRTPSNEDAKNTTVYIQDSMLYAFDDTYDISQYPNRISMHYPYLLVIKPTEQKTYVYNLPTREKTELNEAVLDYSDDGVLKNSGKTTIFNEADLGVLCEKGFINSDAEIICLTKINSNTVENKLVSIDVESKKQTELYVSDDLVSDFSVINDTVYLGEIDLYTKQNYLVIGDERVEVPSVVNLIYQMDGKPYFATFKGELSEEEVYYQAKGDKIELQNGLMYLFK